MFFGRTAEALVGGVLGVMNVFQKASITSWEVLGAMVTKTVRRSICKIE